MNKPMALCLRWGAVLLLLLVCSSLLSLRFQPARAGALLIVTNGNDSGAGSLRQAILDADPGETVTFAGDYTISLSSTLTIDKRMTIDGSGRAITLSRAIYSVGEPQAFSIGASGVVTLNHLTIVNFDCFNSGGAIYNEGSLTLQADTFAHNWGAYGGALYNAGVMTVTGSALTDNGAAYLGGAIYNTGALLVVNSTIADNGIYRGGGGGIYTQGALTLTNSTLVGNRANPAWGGGGLYNAGELHYYNTLIGRNSAGDCANVNVIVANVHNLVEDGSCAAALSGDPRLALLADNGGGTQTLALLADSPAIDAGDAGACPTADQRGMARPQGMACDIGAYEAALTLGYWVAPAPDAPYRSMVTYTLMLRNASAMEVADVSLTDTLPAQVAFGGWIENPGATESAGQITWNGDVPAYADRTFVFTATQTGYYGEIFSSVATFSGAGQTGRDVAVFRVACGEALTVQSANDSGAATLRWAIEGVCPGGVIDFAEDLTIHLSATLSIDKWLTIDGRGRAITVSGDTDDDGVGDVGVFTIGAGGVVTLSGLNIVGGGASGIKNVGVLTVQNSAIVGNTGGNGGGIHTSGILTVTNSTIAGNAAGAWGGGIFNCNGRVALHHVTLSGNHAGTLGGGIAHYWMNEAVLIQANTIIAGNVASSDSETDDCLIAAPFISLGHNLVGGGCLGGGGGVGDQTITDPLLAELADNGGGTLTRALLPGIRRRAAG
ncbi:MAG TPA: choice-of-anchor Q domain-containing protein [Anaerolineae bacterium]|nr:choice-of-anchor Q domain-containing protein [Anaerolineae bacterium]